MVGPANAAHVVRSHQSSRREGIRDDSRLCRHVHRCVAALPAGPVVTGLLAWAAAVPAPIAGGSALSAAVLATVLQRKERKRRRPPGPGIRRHDGSGRVWEYAPLSRQVATSGQVSVWRREVETAASTHRAGRNRLRGRVPAAQ